MVVRVDEAGDDELATGVDDLRVGRDNIRLDACDGAAIDQDVGDSRLVHVRVVIVNPPAADQCLVRYSHGHLPGPSSSQHRMAMRNAAVG